MDRSDRSRISRRAFGYSSLGLLSTAGATPDSPARALDRAFPRLGAALGRAEIGLLPTPASHAVGLGKVLGLERLFVKRDDLSALVYGGGKVRKLERFLGDARARGSSRLVTVGGVNSNHALATAIYARELGLGATLLLLPEPPSESARRKLLVEHGLGAELRLIPNQAAATRELQRLAAETGTYAIPMGGTSPLGNVGFVEAALELGEQVRGGVVPAPDVLYLALGTMGSAAGLLIGLQLAGLETEVVAVRASNPATSSSARLASLHAETVAYLRARDSSFPALEFPASRVKLEGRFLGAGYAAPTPAGTRAAALARDAEGFALDPTYTAKTLAALVDAAPNLRDRAVLFWLSHGTREPEIAVTSGPLPRAFRGYL